MSITPLLLSNHFVGINSQDLEPLVKAHENIISLLTVNRGVILKAKTN